MYCHRKTMTLVSNRKVEDKHPFFYSIKTSSFHAVKKNWIANVSHTCSSEVFVLKDYEDGAIYFTRISRYPMENGIVYVELNMSKVHHSTDVKYSDKKHSTICKWVNLFFRQSGVSFGTNLLWRFDFHA